MSEKTPGKDVIYIDVDDEITGIIDKVRGSGSKIVALVLPKRATVFQSIVNMKLLKRSADEAKKNIVLITSEAGLLPLAGNVGLHVAKSLQTKPEIPDAPTRNESRAEEVEEASDEDESGSVPAAVAADTPVDKSKPVGELAGAAALEETIDLDNEDEEPIAPAAANTAANARNGKKGTDKKLKIPNFNKFRLILILSAIAVVVLAVFGYLAIAVMPKATVAIKTDSQAVNSSTVVTLKTAADTKLDAEEGIAPAKAQQVQKTLNQQVDATGQQNNGAKATGTVTIKNCTDNPVTVPSGTGVSASGLTFITQKATALGSGNFSGGGVCKDTGDHIKTVEVASQSPGAKYNIAAQNYTLSGYGASVTASGSAMTGGTDDITKIVTQADIDSATQKIGSQDSTAIKEQLKTDLTNLGYLPIQDTFNTAAPQTKTSVNAGDKADTVTVTQTVNYTMLGAKKDDLQKIVSEDIAGKIDTKKQSILDYGLDEVVFGVQSQPADGAVLTMQATVVAGPDLDTEEIKKQIAGKKAGDAKEIIKQNPGVTEVDIKYSPFWVSAIPKKTAKITVDIEKPQAPAQSGDSNNADDN
jgi:hypothetical protein